jgi:signal transduction histidine kinase/CheY-like chemotaxis protein
MKKNTTIKAKLLLLVAVPSLALLLLAGNLLFVSKNKLDNTNYVTSLMELTYDGSKLVFNLQRERGLSVGYIKGKSNKTKEVLAKQRVQTDKFLKTFKTNSNIDKNILNSISKINSIRNDIDKNKIDTNKAFDFYTNIITNLLNIQNKVMIESEDKEISQLAHINTKILMAIENAGQERAVLNGIFSGKHLSVDQFQNFSFVHIRQIENLNIYKNLTNRNDNDIFSNIKEYNDFTSIVLNSLGQDIVIADEQKWWEVSTNRINELIKLYTIDEKKLKELIANDQKKFNSIFIITSASIVLIFIIIGIWFRSITSSFISSLNDLGKGIEDFILFVIYRNRKVQEINIDTNDEIGAIANSVNKNIKLLEACFRCDERVIKEVSKAVKNAKTDIHLVQEIKCFADNVMLENMKFDFNEMIDIIKSKTDELALYKENLENIIQDKTSELEKVNENLQLSYKVLEDEKVRLSNFSEFLSNLNSVDVAYLANKTLNNIFDISGALLGFFMVYEKNSLKVLSSKAIDKHTLEINEEFITSSPLIMESLKQNRIIDIQDIDEDSLQAVNIGFAQVKLNNFYSFPLVFQNKPLGVLVLASAKKIDKEYLQGYIHALTGSLNNAISYNYIQHQSLVLEQTNLELQESDKMKSEFLANMSHELRTPLNSVIGFSSILVKNKKGNLEEKQVDQIQKINNNGKHLLGLINDILDLSKIEAGKIELDPKNIDLVHFAKSTTEMLQGQADAKRIQLHFENRTQEDTISINIDDNKLRQIVVNIIGNALKFVPETKGVVTVYLHYKNKNLCLCIQDNGIGISQDKLDIIFEAFRQADGSTTRKFGGTGLGLAISKNMIELLGGNILVESTVDVGSTFCIEIPTSSLAHPVQNDDEEQQKTQNQVKTQMKSILVIDDTQDSRDLIEDYLHDYDDVVIYTASNGEEGLRKAKELKPSLITLDIMMPIMNGWEVLKQIEQDKELKDIPIVVISNVSNEHKALSMGARACLNKPISKNDLSDVIKQNFSFPVDNVLVVDDEPDIQDMMVEMISDVASNIKVASNGKIAYDILESGFKPDAVFLDLMMPEYSGFDFLNMIKYQDKYKDLNIVVVSAKDFTKDDLEILDKKQIPLIKKGSDVEEAVKKALLRA